MKRLVEIIGPAPSEVSLEEFLPRLRKERDRVNAGLQAFRDGTAPSWKELRDKYKDLKYGHGVNTFSQLWKLDLQSWRSKKLVDDKRMIRAFAVTADESRIAMITTPTDQLISHEGRSRVDVFDAATETITSLQDKR